MMALGGPGHRRAWRITVVLASYNEARSISAVLAEIKEAATILEPSGVRLRVILVDDDSPDETAEVAKEWAHDLELDLEVLDGPRAGLGRAMFEGMRAALAGDPDSIVTLDADGQHNPTFIPTLHRVFVARDADLLIGSRWVRGGTSPGTSIVRSLGSRVGNAVFRLVTGTRGVKDATTSFRVYSPRLVRHLMTVESDRFGGYSFFSTTVALAEAAGFVITEVPITFRPRFSGASKFNREEAVRFFTSLSALRRERREGMFGGAADDYRAKDELRLLDGAVRWNRFILDSSLGDLVGDDIAEILEIGSGVGSITEALRTTFPEASITAVEPDSENFAALDTRFDAADRVQPVRGTLASHVTDEHNLARYDLVVYVNVLEHIENDVEELRLAHAALRPGGHVVILVPAMPSLYGPIDLKSGHFRRYHIDRLESTVTRAHLTPLRIEYLDPIGVLPYWVNYRLLNKSGISTGGVWAFDNVFVPLSRLVRRTAPNVPIGKNLMCVARRPAY